jgi:hypothetical protein
MHVNVETNERIKELIAAIQIEPDHKKLTVLVAELNGLLDGDQNTREITPVRDVTSTGPSVNQAARSEGR